MKNRIKQWNRLKFKYRKKNIVSDYFQWSMFMWDIKQVNDFINNNKSNISLIQFDVKSYESTLDTTIIDEVYASNTDLSEPIIVIELSPTENFVIDGHHRLYKALNNGIDKISAYYLPFEIQIQFLVDKEGFDFMIERAKSKI